MRTGRAETQLAIPPAIEVGNRGRSDEPDERETHRLTTVPSDL